MQPERRGIEEGLKLGFAPPQLRPGLFPLRDFRLQPGGLLLQLADDPQPIPLGHRRVRIALRGQDAGLRLAHGEEGLARRARGE